MIPPNYPIRLQHGQFLKRFQVLELRGRNLSVYIVLEERRCSWVPMSHVQYQLEKTVDMVWLLLGVSYLALLQGALQQLQQTETVSLVGLASPLQTQVRKVLVISIR